MMSGTHRRRLTALGLMLLAAAVASAASAIRQHQRYKHFAIHQPGRVYRSAWLEADVMAELVRRHQLHTVVNLCSPGEMGASRWDEERSAVEAAGATVIAVPLTTSIDPNEPTVRRCLEVLRNPENFPMLVHCQHGVTRTSKFLAIYDVAFRGLSADESLVRQPLFGREQQNVHVRAFARQFAASKVGHFE